MYIIITLGHSKFRSEGTKTLNNFYLTSGSTFRYHHEPVCQMQVRVYSIIFPINIAPAEIVRNKAQVLLLMIWANLFLCNTRPASLHFVWLLLITETNQSLFFFSILSRESIKSQDDLAIIEKVCRHLCLCLFTLPVWSR